MITFKDFMSLCEATYDKDAFSGSQIRKDKEGGRVKPERKKSTPERRRMKAVGGGKMEPVDYKPRKDIGQTRQRSEREQAPEKERGSADVRAKAAAAAKEERRKAALARIAAKKKGETPTTEKPKAKEAEKIASQLLRKKEAPKAPHPDYKPQKHSGYSEKERQKLYKHGERELRGIMKQQEIEKYKKATGEAPKGKAKTKVLAHVEKRMSN